MPLNRKRFHFFHNRHPRPNSRTQAALSNAGIKAIESGGNLMVPADERARAYAMLAFNHALPHETKDTFDEIAKSISPLASESSADQLWNHARELAAEQIISEFNDESRRPGSASSRWTIVV